MKNCEEFQKEIFLKIYKEDYDASLDAHLKECAVCKKFYAESKVVFKDKPFVDEIKLASVKNKIKKNSRAFNFKPLYAAAAALLIITMSFLIYKSPQSALEPNDYALIINEEIINNETFAAIEEGLIALETEINAGLFDGFINDALETETI